MGSTDEFLVGGWWRNGNCTLLRRVPPEDPLSSLAPAPGHTGLGRGCGAHLIALFDGVIVWVLRVQHRVAGGIHRRARWLCRRCQTDVSVPVRERLLG